MTTGKAGRKHRHKRRPHGHYSAPPEGTTAELAAHLAPPEEREARAGAQQNGGAIVVDTGALKLPAGFADDTRRRSRLFVDRVVLVLVALALVFTALVAWRVSRMRDEPQPVKVVGE